MKKTLALVVLLATMSFQSVKAEYAPSSSDKVYDLNSFGPDLLDLFYAALQDGRIYPTQAEFEAAGINMMDMAFVRSHVRPRAILLNHAKDINSKVSAGRKLWMNVPIGIGKSQGGYPSANFNDDTFTGWNYTNVFGSWNHGLFHVPGVAVDCAHKNGSDIYSGIKFFESWTAGSGAAGWCATVQTKDNSECGYEGFKYVKPFIHALMYFGHDGLNYNFEDTGYAQDDVVKFHQACYKYAAECGFTNFHIGIYTAQSILTASNVTALLGNNKVKTADAFLNYAASDFQSSTNIASSVNAAIKAMGSCDGVYQGAWIVSMARSWSNLSYSTTTKKMGIVLWGEHSQSRLMSWCSGNSSIDFQEKYQMLQDRFFSGGRRNPASRPTETNSADWVKESDGETGLRTFQGLAEYIPERTAIEQNLPFVTYFNIGNGDRYNYKGKRTHGSWYNLGQQDVVPTYRWLVYVKGTKTAVKDADVIPMFTNADAYIGGSCVRLQGKEAQDIVLYRTKLTVSVGNPRATVALKSTTGATEGIVSVIVKKEGETEWIEVPMQNVSSTNWEEQTAAIEGLAQGDVIEYVGIRTSGDVQGLLLGELCLMDDYEKGPAHIKDAVVEVKQETQVSLSVKVRWDVDAYARTRGAYDLIYNDEAFIDHFEVLYKNGEEGRVSEVGRTTSWGAYVGNIPMSEDEEPYIGVRSASVDGKNYSPVVWVKVPRAAASELPETSVANDAYPQMILNESSEGLTNALTQRYIETFKVENTDADFTYTNTIGTPYMVDKETKTNYIMADNTVGIHQGQTFTATLTIADFTDGLQWCTGRAYIDWDGDCNFNATNDELVWVGGASNEKKFNSIFGSKDAVNRTVSFNVNVPEDAKTGVSRMRVVFSDAWFPHPGAAGCNSKGFCLDFPVNVTGTNAARQAVDTHDVGVAEEPAGDLSGSTEGIKTLKGGVSKAVVGNGQIAFENTDKAWIFNAEGRLMTFQRNGNAVNTTNFAPGVYMIRMQIGNVQRTTKVVVK